MNPRLLAALAAAVLLLPTAPARSQDSAASTPGIPTAVLVDQSLSELHYLQANLNPAYVRASDIPVPNYDYSSAGIVGGALGSAIGTAILNLEAARTAQRQADAMLFELTEPLGKAGLQGMIRQSLAATLPAHGMEQTTLAFTGGAKLEPRHFKRMPTAASAKRFVLVGSGEQAEGVVVMPVALHDSLRQLRLAVDVEVREGSPDRNRRLFRRDVVYFGDPIAVPEDGKPLDLLAADEQALLRRQVAQAVEAAMALAHNDREFPDVAKGDEVGVVNELGLTEFEGVLLEESEGRALVWTRDESYVSLPSGQIVRGGELMAARELETARRSPPASEETTSVQGGAQPAVETEATPDAAPEAAPEVVAPEEAAPETLPEAATDTELDA